MVWTLKQIELWIAVILQYGCLALAVWALVDSAIRPVVAFTYTEKLTKPAWVLINALSCVVLYFFGFMHLLGLFAMTAVGVYLADVRPAVRGVQRGDSRW